MRRKNINKLNTKTFFVDWLSIKDREKHQPKFTYKEKDLVRDGKTYKSLYGLYMECADEYDFAMTHLGSLNTFEQFLETKWFTEGHRAHRGIEAWREDMRARDESIAKKALMLAVKDGSIQAANKLFDISKKAATQTKRGRFVKEEAKKEAVKLAEDDLFLNDAASRLDNVISIMD